MKAEHFEAWWETQCRSLPCEDPKELARAMWERFNTEPKLQEYMFFRAEGFYFLELPNDAAAIASVKSNPGTLKVSHVASNRVVWDAESARVSPRDMDDLRAILEGWRARWRDGDQLPASDDELSACISDLEEIIEPLPKPARRPTEPVKYSYSFDEETYRGEFTSVADALEEAFEEDAEAESVCIGECDTPEPSYYFDASDVIEHIQQQEEFSGEWAETWPHASKEDLANLTLRLQAAFRAWEQAREIEVHFFNIENAKSYTREEWEAMKASSSVSPRLSGEILPPQP